MTSLASFPAQHVPCSCFAALAFRVHDEIARTPVLVAREEGVRHGLCDCVMHQAAALFGVSVRALRQPGRSPLAVSRVRQIAMYVSHTILGLSMREVGRAFERDRTTVLHACQVVEELRELPEFDEAVAMMERLAAALLRLRNQREK